MHSPFNTLLIGFGKIAAGYTEEPDFQKHIKYATHAQILKEHPDFQWRAVVDPCKTARQKAQNNWNIPITVAHLSELPENYQPEVVVFATPPTERLNMLKQLKPHKLKAVFMEKPLAPTLAESLEIIEYCNKENIDLQVNLWRRADSWYNKLKNGELEQLIGMPQRVICFYGNGLKNNGLHFVDLIRFLLGEVISVESLPGCQLSARTAFKNDLNLNFILQLENKLHIIFQGLNYQYFSELMVDLWGSTGRLSFHGGGVYNLYYPLKTHRLVSSLNELQMDKPQTIPSTIGDAFYHMYTNLSQTIKNQSHLLSSGEEYYKTARVIEAIFASHHSGKKVICNKFSE